MAKLSTTLRGLALIIRHFPLEIRRELAQTCGVLRRRCLSRRIPIYNSTIIMEFLHRSSNRGGRSADDVLLEQMEGRLIQSGYVPRLCVHLSIPLILKTSTTYRGLDIVVRSKFDSDISQLYPIYLRVLLRTPILRRLSISSPDSRAASNFPVDFLPLGRMRTVQWLELTGKIVRPRTLAVIFPNLTRLVLDVREYQYSFMDLCDVTSSLGSLQELSMPVAMDRGMKTLQQCKQSANLRRFSLANERDESISLDTTRQASFMARCDVFSVRIKSLHAQYTDRVSIFLQFVLELPQSLTELVVPVAPTDDTYWVYGDRDWQLLRAVEICDRIACFLPTIEVVEFFFMGEWEGHWRKTRRHRIQRSPDSAAGWSYSTR